MSDSIRDAFKKAYAEKGEGLSKKRNGSTSLQHSQKASVKVQRVSTKKPDFSDKIRKNSPNRLAIKEKNLDVSRRNSVVTLTSQARKSGSASPTQKKATLPWTLGIERNAKLHSFISEKLYSQGLISLEYNGIAEQYKNSNGKDVREIIIGLDFGTSSTKVVIADRSLGQAFAVPFINTAGVDGYLLPSRLWQTDENFSLSAGRKVYRDMKLSLLVPGETKEALERATAFLALVIRHSRGWLFSEHSEIYQNTRIVWKLVLGIPAENYPKENDKPDSSINQIFSQFHRLARAAWLTAGKRRKEISLELVQKVLDSTQSLVNEKKTEIDSNGIEIDVVPELSAQIYGFLRSQRFDPNAKNCFVMVDVGAGTVDSALFHVWREKGKWCFVYYTNLVRPNGVMNLHRMRVKWWIKALNGRSEPAVPSMEESLRKNFLSTDQMVAIPESLNEYFDGASLKFVESDAHPDEEYFRKNLLVQVQSNTIYGAWKSNLLTQENLKDIPLFLCGGGIRMKYYRRLEDRLKQFPGCTWLRALAKPLVIPKDLRVLGVPKVDYDRLSVAYGLSSLDVGKIIRGLPPPKKLNTESAWHFTDRFISKDQI